MQKAIYALAHIGKILKKSSVFSSEPIGEIDQEMFLNALLKFETKVTPLQLLDKIKNLHLLI